jgi:DNA primase
MIFKKAKEVNILQLIETYNLGTPTRKYGKYFIKSPIKVENTASLCIYPHTNSWYDFASNVGGDAVRLVSLVFGLDAKESAQKICQDFGLSGDSQISSKQLQHEIKRREAKKEEESRLNRELDLFFKDSVKKYKYYENMLRRVIEILNPEDEAFKICLLGRNYYENICLLFVNGNYEEWLKAYTSEVAG